MGFKLPLTSGDRFVVGLNIQCETKARFAFYKDILRVDNKPVMRAKTIDAALNVRGRPLIAAELDTLLSDG